MSRKIIGVTVGTPTSPDKIKDELKPVLYTEQTLSTEQQAEARGNIGAISAEEVNTLINKAMGVIENGTY